MQNIKIADMHELCILPPRIRHPDTGFKIPKNANSSEHSSTKLKTYIEKFEIYIINIFGEKSGKFP